MNTEGTADIRWGQAAQRWWTSLQDRRADGAPNRSRDRAAIARLRRASTPGDAFDEPSVFDLYRSLGFGVRQNEVVRRLPRVAVLAAVLAQVKPSDGREGGKQRLATMLGVKAGEDRPVMSPLRFKRLLVADAEQEILTQFRRAVALVGARNIDIGDLAESLLEWGKDPRRMRWAFDYYGAERAAPNATESSSPADED